MTVDECFERIRLLRDLYKSYTMLYNDDSSSFYRCYFTRELLNKTINEVERLEELANLGELDDSWEVSVEK